MTGKPVGSFGRARDQRLDASYPLAPVTVTRNAIRRVSRTRTQINEQFIGAPFIGATPNDLASRLAARIDTNYPIYKSFFEGDHWQKGTQWAGPWPDAQDEEGREARKQLQRGFVSKNAIKEILERKRNGVVGREPHWYKTIDKPTNDARTRGGFALTAPEPAPADPPAPTPSNGGDPPQPSTAVKEPASPYTPEEVGLISESETDQTRWWTTKRVHESIKEGFVTACIAEYAPFRIYIPPGFIDPETGDPVQGAVETIEDAYALIHLDLPDPRNAGILVNPTTMREMAVYTYRDDLGIRHAEVSYLEGIKKSTALTVIEHIEGNESGGIRRSVVRNNGTIVPQDGEAPVAVGVEGESEEQPTFATSAKLELGGHMLMYELRLPPMITPQIVQQQRMLNVVLTMAGANTVLSGFLERTILNGQLTGHFEQDPSRPDDPKAKIFVRDPYMTGIGAVNHINGLPIPTPDGSGVGGLTTPSIEYGQPSTSEAFVSGKDMFYRAILEEVNQIHYLLSSEQYASGESRKQSRADFEADLRNARAAVNGLIDWLLTTSEALASWLVDGSNKYKTLRTVPDTRIDPGPATSETIRSAIELNEAQGLSNQSMMIWASVENPDEERKLMAAERAQGIVPSSERAAALQAAALAATSQQAPGQPQKPGDRLSDRAARRNKQQTNKDRRPNSAQRQPAASGGGNN